MSKRKVPDRHQLYKRDMTDAEFGELTTYAPGPKLSRSPARIRASAPRLGADNDAVYGSLGLGDREQQALREDRII